MQLDKSYKEFIVELKQKIYSSKTKAILSANRLMIELYFEIGQQIVINQENQGWGKSVVEQMSKDLKDEFGQKCGYSVQNLWYMRQFYNSYKETPNLQQLVGEIPWGSNIVIFTVKMPHENPSIGIILCSDKDSLEVEYSLLNTSQPMGVSTYSVKDRLPSEFKNSLPTQEELEKQLLGDNE
jgi:predicted nuclease of restriction endonuclease-like (RecB) superfamily